VPDEAVTESATSEYPFEIAAPMRPFATFLTIDMSATMAVPVARQSSWNDGSVPPTTDCASGLQLAPPN
jgi:hypothetical protein